MVALQFVGRDDLGAPFSKAKLYKRRTLQVSMILIHTIGQKAEHY